MRNKENTRREEMKTQKDKQDKVRNTASECDYRTHFVRRNI